MKTFIDFQSLEALDFVSHPLWVFDVDKHGIFWGNKAAIELWRAKDLEDLIARDFSTDSQSVKDKTLAYFDSGVMTTEIWTFFPAGERETRVNNHSPCLIGPEARRALMTEALPFETNNDQESNARLQMLQMMRYTNVLVTMFDLTGKVICQNPVASTTYLSPDIKSSNLDFLSRFHSEDEGRKLFAEAKAGIDIDAEVEMKTAKGVRTHSVSVRAGRDPATGGACFVVSEEDITALATALSAAEDSNRTKSEFISMVSHEVRTPIAGILGLAEIMLTSQKDPKHVQNLLRVKKSGQHLIEIVNDLLDIAKLEAKGIVLQNKKTNLEEFVTDVHSFWEPSIHEKGLNFPCVLSGDTSIDVLLDPSRLRQVLNNLISNARKFTTQGEISLTVKATRDTNAQLNILFEVSDSGRGFSQKFAQDIFEPFTQEGASDSDEKGTGLGLRICNQLLELMGTNLKCKSSLEKGSSFWFELIAPIAVATQAKPITLTRNPPQASSFADFSAQLGRSLRFLVVDDNEANRRILEAFLIPTGAEIQFAVDGATAYACVDEGSFDLVLMDAYMPVMDGLESAKCIRNLSNEKAKTPILALTASGLDKDRQNCLDAGMNAVLTKPIDRKLLYAEVLTLLQTSELLN